MRKTFLVGFISAIALMACSAFVNAEITTVVDGNFEAEGDCGGGKPAPWSYSAWIGEGAIFMDSDYVYATVGEDRGPGPADMNWLTLWQISSGTARAYQDLGTTEATGFYVAQAIMQRHLTLGYDISPFKFSLRNSSTDAELASSGLTELFWVVPGADLRSETPPYLLAEVTFQATSATALRVQLESVPSTLGLARLGVDDVRVVNELLGANNPIPARWATEVNSNTLLQWTAGSTGGVSGYNVYLGTDPEILVLQNTTPLTTTSYDPAIVNDTIYYWRVDAVDSFGNPVVVGNVWAFRTKLSLPVIVQQPACAGGLPGDDVTFTVSATDPLGGSLSYQWYRDPNTLLPGDEVALTEGADYEGVDTNTLKVLDIDETVLGISFFCAVVNAAGTVNTNLVTVNMAGMVYYWPFDGSTDDAKGMANFVEAYSDPDYETGVVGQALSLDGDDGLKYNNVWLHFADNDAPAAARFVPSDDVGSSTMTLWIKPANVSQQYINIFCRYVSGYQLRRLGYLNTDGNMRFRDIIFTGDTLWADLDFAGVIANDEWTFLALRFDTHETTLFVNGVPHLRSFRDGKSVAALSGTDFLIGCGTPTSQFYAGAIDEFKIYNYPLTDTQIAQEYADIAGSSVCVSDIPANIVEDGSCTVDLADFAALAAQWLQDLNVYPNP